MKKLFSTSFFSGLSGLQLPVPKYLYPPPFENATRLTYYSYLFNSIEINSSFYKIPQAAKITKWADSVPHDFTFTFKLYKEVTHSKGFDYSQDDVIKFFKAINAVNNKKGCVLIQFPSGFGMEYMVQVENLLQCIKEAESSAWNIAVEFRNKSWYTETTYNLIAFYNAALVIHDIPKSATPFVNHESDFIYVIFHGPTGNYRENYTEDFLSEYVTYINEWVAEGKKVFMYFNNTMGDALNNLKTINGFLQDYIPTEQDLIKQEHGTY